MGTDPPPFSRHVGVEMIKSLGNLRVVIALLPPLRDNFRKPDIAL